MKNVLIALLLLLISTTSYSQNDSIKPYISRDSSFLEKDYLSTLDALSHTSIINKIKNKIPLIVNAINIKSIDSCGGVDLSFSGMNIVNKDIKYIYINGYPINAVGDKCFCHIRKHSNTICKVTGPIKFMQYRNETFSNVWDDSTIEEFIPTSIKIQYMDGSISTMNQAKIKESQSYSSLINRPVNLNNISLPFGQFYLLGYGLYDGTKLLTSFTSILSDKNNYVDISDKCFRIYKNGHLLYEFYLSSLLKTHIDYSLYEFNHKKTFSIKCLPHNNSSKDTFYSITISSENQKSEVFFFSLANIK